MSSHHGEEHIAEHQIHVPQPSFSPPILGLGVMLIAFVFFVLGIATWLIDDARAYQQAGDPTDGAHH